MKFSVVHNNINVLDLDKSLTFYEEALGMKEVCRKEAEDGSFILSYIANDSATHQMELTWLRDRKEPYDLGDNEFHTAFVTDDFVGALKKHRDMNAVCFENEEMGIYFIADPDGYWLEVVPQQ